MKYSIITNLFTTLILSFTLLAFSTTVNAHDVEPALNPSISAKEVPTVTKGGPRNVIQERSSITVIQPTNTYLKITVVDMTGNVAEEVITTDYKTIIYTDSWASGDYTVITVDDAGDHQDFYIHIE